MIVEVNKITCFKNKYLLIFNYVSYIFGMNFLKKFIFIYFLMLSSIFAKQSDVVNIRLNTNKNKERIVIDSTEKINFNAFTLQKPFRLVVDLQDTNLNIKAPSFNADKVVDTLRVGKFSETDTRLVFDLNINVKIEKSFYLAPNNQNKYHRIVLDLEFKEQDLENEDIIGKLIEENSLYDIEPNALNEIIDNILKEKPKQNVKIVQKAKIISTPKKQVEYDVIISKRKPRIIIDAGHGGKDPGTIGLRGTKEKIITLTYAKSLKEALDKTGRYKVYLTRNQDFFIELRERVSIARRYKGDLFISIHADSALNSKAQGLSIYTLSQKASDTRTAKLAQKENKADIIGGLNLYGEYQETINTLVDISRRQAMNDSKIFAKILEKQLLKRNINPLGTMIKYANFAVLTSADMPSILLELGFLSNKTDERMIRSFGYKTKITNSIVSAVDDYFK